jgi:hypothetical protein
MLSAAQDLHV